MTLTIYHNPRCSKSRQTLDLIKASGMDHKIHLYLQDPLTEADITKLLVTLNYKSPRELMRTNEGIYRDLDLKSETNHLTLIRAMVNHPKLIERPIIEHKGRAVLGRPPENVQILLKP